MTANTEWTVLRHDAPEALASGVWRVEGVLPRIGMHRCMVVVRLQSGDLLLHNAIALDEAGMAWLEGLGRPAWMVVPNRLHRMDAARYKARYADLRVVGPAGAHSRIAQVVAVDHNFDDAAPGPPVAFEHLEGTRRGEGVMRIAGEDGTTLVLNDALFNLPHGRGLFWFIYGRLLGSTGGPKITALARLLLVKDKRAFAAHLLRLADTPDLRRIVVAHGAVIDDRPADVLRNVASF